MHRHALCHSVTVVPKTPGNNPMTECLIHTDDRECANAEIENGKYSIRTSQGCSKLATLLAQSSLTAKEPAFCKDHQ